jgi:hypothetical protein
VPPPAPVLDIIPIAEVNSIHLVGLIVKELLPASAKRGSNSTPFKIGVMQLLPKPQIFQSILLSHPILDNILWLKEILLPSYICYRDIVEMFVHTS